ncbi:MAG: glycoside hydrolase/phage tail family protein [Caulobacterales bacterium]|nr:glycoside hydrolase/phage tail family protein [Caulobacterales bacterium]
MAQVILGGVGRALGGALGAALGGFLGGAIERAVIGGLQPARQIGPRLRELQLMGAAEGAPMAAVFGRARVAGQVIWAARFKEKRVERQAGGGKGGPKTVEYRYSLSFAVALCEGPIDGIGRVWADGKPMDLSGAAMRLYRGGEDQTPDPLIEAVEGSAPAWRGCAYVVFEDLPLEPYGNRPPQLSFEVFRRPPSDAGLEARLTSVCLIPGAGEFVYATEVIHRRDGLTRLTAENVNNGEGRPDLLVSLDQLQAQLPNLQEVTLVVAWFGTSTDAGACQFRPGVEQADKATLPWTWRAGGVGRGAAHLISHHEGGPAYGGTPADRAVLQAIAELKARGLKVTLYPFILMDCAGYPWRGRISGEATDIVDLFGGASPADFTADGQTVGYAGPADWGLRRMILHHAKLAQMAGGVDGFLIGSELRGITAIRDGDSFPAVEALRDLAADCRAVLGSETAIGYAADWSEYFGHQPADGSGDIFFHLDPLWANANIDFIGVDFYPPLADWRDGEARDAFDIASGEDFDWFYASPEDRAARVRTAITDGAHGEPWVFRPKDLIGWWSNAHHDRPGGVRSVTPTDWIPCSKPIRLIEFGCPAVDKGANAPNLFIDPKSSESALPPFSSGARDDLGQRRTLEAVLGHFADSSNNPVSPIYGGPMVAGMSAWCWDARPFPDFPARNSIWADGSNWALGHWLNGRAGAAPLADLVRALADRAGVTLDPGDINGVVSGYVVEAPMRLRDALEPLALAFGFDAAERNGTATLIAGDGPAVATLDDDDLALPDDRGPRADTRALETPPDELRLRFIDETADYRLGGLTVRRDPADGGGVELIDLPIVGPIAMAEQVGRRALARGLAVRAVRTAHLSPLAALTFEPGDRLAFAGEDAVWRLASLDRDVHPRAGLQVAEAEPDADLGLPDWTPPATTEPAGPPRLDLLALPPRPGAEDDARPLVAAGLEPWRDLDVHAGVDAGSLTVRAAITQPAGVGETLTGLPAGPFYRFDHVTRLTLRLEGATPESRPAAAVLAGANALAIRGADGDWEIVQFLTAEIAGEDVLTLSGLLRGQGGSDPAMAGLTGAGAPVVLLGEGLARGQVALSERDLPLIWRAAPAGNPAGGNAMTQADFTWRALALRPWSPAHLTLEAAEGGDLLFHWIRRARLGGDGWETEPPLSEEREVYRIEILDGETVVRTAEIDAPTFNWTAAMQAADFPSGVSDPVAVRVAQGSATFGWGSTTQRSLWR